MWLGLEPRGQRSAFWTYGSPVLALLLTVVTAAIIFAALGQDPAEALWTFLIEPLTSASGLPELFVKAAPLILIGVGLSIGFRANVWNIGAEGQFTLGAIFGGWLALRVGEGSGWWIFPAMLLLSILGGMIWAAIPAFLKTRFNANEILTSLMLTYVAQLLLLYLVTGPWKDPEGYGFPQTAMFGDGATAPILIPETRLHLGVLIALAAALLGWLILSKSLLGFQLRVLGSAPRAARFAGFSEAGLIWLSLLLGGGLAGLAGLFEVAGPIGQLTPSISPGYGFTAIIVAFLGRLHPLGVVLAGLVLALSYLGGEAAQIDLGLPNAVTGIFQGILLFYLLGCDVLILYRLRLGRKQPPAKHLREASR
ncbi:ABC transporter permease [Dongia soli]|uniref:ABC transporter permease n=1 Tax=Dongia soli TaxID=600628 RepID=A0ABU5EFQ9_9PROT|nr:ABC transporter permease [Dongia soli]MDY0885167.1 ABC transporter permease [Dongia soli]